MNSTLWPFTCDGETFLEPQMLARNKFEIIHQPSPKASKTPKDFLCAIESSPKLWSYILKIKSKLTEEFLCYIDRISCSFVPEIGIGSIARIKVPATEWQKQEHHRYVICDLIHCANYEHHLFPFHDADNQYGVFFIDINKSIQNDEIKRFFNPDVWGPSGDDEEYLWCDLDNLELIYSAGTDDDEKDKIIGFKNLQIKYLKNLNNERLDEMDESSDEIIKILLSRLRGKMRLGYHGTIISVQGIISKLSVQGIIDKLMDIADKDDNYSNNNNVESYRISRKKLFCSLKINAIFLARVYDDYGKELKLKQSIRNCELYKEAISYKEEINKLIYSIHKKYKKRREIDTFHAFNGLRISYNTNTKTIKLTTNNYCSSLSFNKEKFSITRELGRKTNW